jgi:hypothetical protein
MDDSQTKSPKKTWTRQEILDLLDNRVEAVERAILFLYTQQTRDEQSQNVTKYRNGRGFTATTASRGCYYAKWLLGKNRLSGHHVAKAREIAKGHVKQLVAHANGENE